MRRRLPLIVALLALPAWTLTAQTADQARLVFSVGLGQTTGGGELWRVGRQPFNGDTLAVSRSFRRSLNISFGATYFPGDNLGINAEAQLLGLGSRDGCAIVSTEDPPGALTQAACADIGGNTRTSSSGSLSLGLVYRIMSKASIHPYVRANAGLLVSQESFLKLVATTPGSGGIEADSPIYLDDSPDNLQPYFSFGGGVVAALGRGYQLRFEVRDNWVRVPVVTGPTSGAPAFTPSNTTEGRHVLSFVVGFDVVLERKRGRRY
jgi:hypothetical protein